MEPRFEGHGVSALASLGTLVPVVFALARLTTLAFYPVEKVGLAQLAVGRARSGAEARPNLDLTVLAEVLSDLRLKLVLRARIAGRLATRDLEPARWAPEGHPGTWLES